MTALKKLIGLFLSCGLSEEEYRAIKPDAYRSNFQVWRRLHPLLLAGYLILTAVLSLFSSPSPAIYIHIGMMIYLAAVTALFFTVFREEALLPQFIIYLTMVLLLLAALLVSFFEPDTMAVTFIVLLVMLPVFMIDRPCFMALLLSCAAAVYLLALRGIKPPELYRTESIFILFYGIFGIIINTFYNTVRIREFTLSLRSRELISEAERAAEETGKLNGVLKAMSENTLELLGDVVEERDAESGEHIRRVKGYSYILAREVMEVLPEYGLDEYTVDLIASASALHDVGKISIPDAILCKPGKLTADEFEIMKGHCVKGCDIIAKMRDKWSPDYLEMGMTICRSHHEKWDGRGYPDGLAGDDIPIAAQIVSIADCYDALTSKRVYKDAYPLEEAFRMILSGQCGAFSGKLLSCFVRCHERFEAHFRDPSALVFGERDYELISRSNPGESFVIGLHDGDRDLREKLRLGEELSVLESLSENFCYVCYVDMAANEVIRFRADPQFTRILNSYGTALPSNERFDKLLNSIIVSDDYAAFRAATERTSAVETLRTSGHLTTDFRIRLDDGIHHCRMRISLNRNDPNAVIIGISKRDEEYRLETEYFKVQHELELARREMENREKLADRLAVIDCISSEYDYVCSLNADTMDVVVYRAEEWIRDMFKNLEDIVVSPEARDATLRGIVHPDDFDRFQAGSRHEAVLRGLMAGGGTYTVNYRAYKYGRLVLYQTRYTLDKNDPKRIIIGLRCLGDAQEVPHADR